jgi:hypothetical protein
MVQAENPTVPVSYKVRLADKLVTAPFPFIIRIELFDPATVAAS